jgi:putative ABC transport system ATP-binding protein
MTHAELTVCRLQGVRFGWPRLPSLLVINDLSLQAGETLFIGGPSGSGKSTLLGLLSGVLQAQAGAVMVAGEHFTQATPAVRDRVRADHLGVIFQQFNLLPYLSVLENVQLPLMFSARRLKASQERYGSGLKQAEHLLHALGLDRSLWKQRAHQLSVGQQQRVAVCRALMGAPSLIIADEPTSALDEGNRHSFLELLIRTREEQGAALVMVSHDLRMATRFERTLILGQPEATT